MPTPVLTVRFFLLSLVVGYALAGCGAADEVDGLTFQSEAQVEMGLGPNGAVRGQATLSFQGGEYNWRHSDLVCHGKYTYDDGAITAETRIPCKSFGELRGTYDPDSRRLIWNGTVYVSK